MPFLLVGKPPVQGIRALLSLALLLRLLQQHYLHHHVGLECSGLNGVIVSIGLKQSCNLTYEGLPSPAAGSQEDVVFPLDNFFVAVFNEPAKCATIQIAPQEDAVSGAVSDDSFKARSLTEAGKVTP